MESHLHYREKHTWAVMLSKRSNSLGSDRHESSLSETDGGSPEDWEPPVIVNRYQRGVENWSACATP